MTEIYNSKRYDLEERTFQFAKGVALFVKQSPRNISNLEYGRQVKKDIFFYPGKIKIVSVIW